MSVQELSLNSGYSIPILGLGTWLSEPGQVAEAVRIAVLTGYRHIDCAHVYENQKEIGEELNKLFAEGVVKRSDLFITSKVWNTFHSYDLTIKNVEGIISDLKCEYLDLCLIHWPHGYEEGGPIFPMTDDGKKTKYSNVDFLETWRGMEFCVKEKKIRSIGISNFNHKQIERILENCTIFPSMLQVELHPYFQQKKLREFCNSKGILVTAYSSLGNPAMPFRKATDPNILVDPIIGRIAKNHSKTPAQVALRWAIQNNIIVIPKSVNPARINENFNLFDFDLSADEINELNKLDRNFRFLEIERDSDHSLYPFHEKY